MKYSSSISFAMAAMFMLSIGIASAEEPADTPQVKTDAPAKTEKPTSPKEETASPKPTETNTDKPKEEPNCE